MLRSARRALMAVLVATGTLLGLTALPAVAAPSTLTVNVVDSVTGQAIPNACVTAYRATDASYAGGGCAPPFGAPVGQVVLQLDDATGYKLQSSASADYLGAWYGGADSSTATAVSPPATITFAKVQGVRPTGRLSLPGGAAAVGYSVQVQSTTTSDSSYVTTGSGGYWQAYVALPPGAYTVKFTDPDQGSSWAYGKRTAAEATAITLTVGVATPIDDTFLAPPRGTISGKLVDAATKAPLVNVCVGYEALTADRSYWMGQRRGCTDSSGTYTLTNIPVGSVLLRYEDDSLTYPTRYSGGSYRLSGAKPVTVTDGVTTTVPRMALPRGAVLTGTVLNADGTPNTSVCASVFIGRSQEYTVPPAVDRCTDANGTWAVSGLPTGPLTVSVQDYAHPTGQVPTVDTWAPGVEKQSQAKVFTATSGGTTDVGAVTLLVGGVVTGVVKDQSTGRPIPGISVDLSGGHGARAGGIDGPYGAVTDQNGAYRIIGVPTGSYGPIAYGRDGTYGAEWYGDATDPANAKKVRVALGSTKTANFTLGAGASLSVALTEGPTSGPLEYVNIDAYTVSGAMVGYSGSIVDGHVTITGLAPGVYKLAIQHFDGTSNVLQWYGGAGAASATRITVPASGASVAWTLP